MRDEYRLMNSELERMKEGVSAKDDEIQLLQAGLDQSLLALQ